MKTFGFIAVTAFSMLLSAQQVGAKDVTVTVRNDAGVQRQELVEVDAASVYRTLGIGKGEPFIVRNALGQEVASQVTYDGKILVDAAVRPKGTAVFTITKGTPKPMKTFVCGKQYPERVDDVAWENDRTAYRVYGPALQRSGERAFGVDVWVKNTPDLEVDKRYVTELSNHHKIQELKKAGKNEEAREMEQATTYHYDHGYGLDCYKVGPTLGGGAPALMDDNGLVLPYCYKTYEILDNGPLRFTVKLVYNPAKIGKDANVVEHRLLSLDKGSNFNRMEVWFDGLTQPRKLAAGVVIHSEDTESVVLDKDMVLYADPTDNPAKQNFQIYVGALFPYGNVTTQRVADAQPVPGAAGHAVGVTEYKPGERFVYYFGSAWSKNDVRTFNEWKLRASETIDALRAPLKVTVE